MQNQIRVRQTSMQISWTHKFIKYFGTFYGLAAVSLTAGYEVYLLIKNVNLLHLYFYIAKSSFCIITNEAETILDTESTLLELPEGLLTYEDLEKIGSQRKFFIEK
ncbi:PLRKT protein, partial [Chloroceryle aenea]|nr:PLRKT protein [Chloroceryle aenea]